MPQRIGRLLASLKKNQGDGMGGVKRGAGGDQKNWRNARRKKKPKTPQGDKKRAGARSKTVTSI